MQSWFRTKGKRGRCSAPLLAIELLRNLDQLQLAVFAPVQDLDVVLWIAEDEDFPVAELAFLDGLFQLHRPERDRIFAADEVSGGGAGYIGEAVDGDGNRGDGRRRRG